MDSPEESDGQPDLHEVEDRAVRLLARREHSRRELATKLRQRDYPVELIDEALTALEQRGYLSNQRFAESFVRERINRGQGPARITADLRQRGIDDATIQLQLEQADVDWLAQAAEVRARRFGHEAPADHREWGRQGRFLAGRGFSAEQISRVLGDRWRGD